MRLTQRFAPDHLVIWRGAGDRCAVDFSEMNLPIPDEEALAILIDEGFSLVEVDPVQVARACCGKSTYRRGALPEEAPGVVDCSTLTWWTYSELGIELPRYSVSQRQAMTDSGIFDPGQLQQIRPGDVIFIRGRHPYWLTDPQDGVGHVGLLTGEGTVIHAASKARGVVEDPLDIFIRDWQDFRGIGRVLPPDRKVVTLSTPPGRSVRWTIDLHRKILQSLPVAD
ncbi:MAG: hypothetical protein CEO22_157 [Candidatus Berkelbacteria bacterium Gr01-1014_85]|uniref:NlpC/P60 domain-containing protein n=1 Tax=Candidatus Berkelbacteria bacterium Gr01-1014_85 TaxID=2017150 RepID=A0A554JCZ6_9BACT|nr:MAG: hypothetical protein CEO22_157 [Candidatus Berkelbacteria bacterium Gr01-1014_85]